MTEKTPKPLSLLSATQGGEGKIHVRIMWDEKNMPDEQPTIPGLDGLVAQILCGQCPLCQRDTDPDLKPLNLEPGWYCRAGLKRLKRRPIYLGKDKPAAFPATVRVPKEYVSPIPIMYKWPQLFGGVHTEVMVQPEGREEFQCDDSFMREEVLMLPDMYTRQKASNA